MRRVGRVLRSVLTQVARAIRALRPRGSSAARSAAWLALITSALFFVGAAATYTTQVFLNFGPIAWAGLGDGSETARVIRALATVFAMIQVGFGLVYALLAFDAWRGRTGFLTALARGDGAGYALLMLCAIFGGFALNFPALLAVALLFSHLARSGSDLEEASKRAPVEDALAVLARRHRVEPVRSPDGSPQSVLQGQIVCHQCGLPNPSGRKRCRVCASHIFDIPVPEVTLITPQEAGEPVPVLVPRRRRRRRQMQAAER